MLKQINKLFFIVICLIGFFTTKPVFAVLSCSVTTAAGCSNTVVLRMSSASNAHTELPWQSTAGYVNNVVCCSGIVGTLCSGNTATVLKLSSSTNAHVELGTNTNYATSSCISAGSNIPMIAYQDSNCTGYDTTLLSISSTTNAMVGTSTVYTKKVCGSVVPASITFTLSTTTLYFGNMSYVAVRYASSTNSGGDSIQTEAHRFTVKTNAMNGYGVTVKGQTLTSGGYTIDAIGGTSTSSSVGTEQFGLRIVASGGTGSVVSPYASSGFAFAATATTTSLVANNSVGDNATTTYSVRYIANVAPSTDPASYTANLVYIATANF